MNKLFVPTVSLWLLFTTPAALSLNVGSSDDSPIQVIYAVNVCGSRITVNGTTYEADPSYTGPYDCVGSSYDKSEATLQTHYRTEEQFDFVLPKPTDGHYVLRLGQGDAYPYHFDVFLNGRHKLTSANNHFQVIDGLLKYKDEDSYVSQTRNSLVLHFRGYPKATVASILLVKGELADLKAAKWVSETEYQSRVLEQLSQLLTMLKELINNKVN